MFKNQRLLAFALLVTLSFLCCAYHLAIADSEVEAVESIPLTGVWKFKPDPDGIGENEKWYSTGLDDSRWEDIGVPGTWNEGQNVNVAWDYEGYGWYRRRIEVPQDWRGANIHLRFLAVYLIADVWLNGNYLGNHKGGYTAFSFDVSEQIDFDSPNVLVVRADSKKRTFQVPGVSIDWWNCGGITREVFLEKHPDISLTKMFITTDDILSEKAGANVTAWLESRFDSQKEIEIRADVIYDGKVISASEKQFLIPATEKQTSGVYTFSLDVDNPKLWSPDSPELYTLKLSWRLKGEDGWWTHKDRFGIRKIETRGTELYLNGKKIWLQGIAIHQDYAGMGSAVTHEAQRSDLEHIKKLNANFVRLGHYPFHPNYLDVCDEIGLLVWSEIPVWQNSPEELANEEMYQEWVKPQLDEMIDQQYNHPSVVFWSVANEISRVWGGEPEPTEIINYIKRTTDCVRERDPTRLVSYASAASTGGGTWEFLDVIGKPMHYGWFHSANVYDLGPETDKVHSILSDRPILAVELCGMSYPDDHKGYSEDARFSVEYHDKLLRIDMQHLMIRKSFVCGVTLWTLADLKGGREKGTYGILDRERNLVKHIYETLKNLYAKNPKLLIIDSTTGYKPGDELKVDFWSFNLLDQGFDQCKLRWWIKGKNGRTAGGENIVDIAPDSANKVACAVWKIPENELGFHSLFCTLEDSEGNLMFVNDYYFDIGAPEKPAILWVKVTDNQGNLLQDANVQIDGFTRVTDEFGRVPFLLNTGSYNVKVEVKGKVAEAKAEAELGTINEITVKL